MTAWTSYIIPCFLPSLEWSTQPQKWTENALLQQNLPSRGACESSCPPENSRNYTNFLMQQFTGIVVKSMASPRCWEMSGRGRNLERVRTCKRSKTCCLRVFERIDAELLQRYRQINQLLGVASMRFNVTERLSWPVDCDLLGVQRPWVGIVQAVCAVVVDHLPQLHPLHSSWHGDPKQRAIQKIVTVIVIVILKGRTAGKLGFQGFRLLQFQRGEVGLPPSPRW